MSIFFGVPVDLAYHLVCWIAAILAPLAGGLATAAAIIAFTLLVRLLLLPLSYVAVRGSVRGEVARARLQPRIAELRRRHRKDPQRLQAELAALYRAEGSGMFAGFLPLLLQLPVFSVLYRLFLDHSVGGAPNTLLSAACSPRRWAVTGWPGPARSAPRGPCSQGCSRCSRRSPCWPSGPPAVRRPWSRPPRPPPRRDRREGRRRPPPRLAARSAW